MMYTALVSTKTHCLCVNLKSRNLDPALIKEFLGDFARQCVMPFEDGFFDFIISNQVLYYLPSEEHIHNVCKELSRCLRLGGVVFFTMTDPKNYCITHHTKQIHHRNVYGISIEEPGHRLEGVTKLIYLVRDEAYLIPNLSA